MGEEEIACGALKLRVAVLMFRLELVLSGLFFVPVQPGAGLLLILPVRLNG